MVYLSIQFPLLILHTRLENKMKYFILIFLFILTFILPGCSGDRAAELYDTAKFEELQNNREHALKLYKEIIEKYPDSSYAVKAGERLSQLKQK